MTRSQEALRIGGREIQRYIFTPGPDRPIRAAAIHFHGHGDYASRHEETLRVFTRHGIACIASDLPGHGLSDGRRGCIPGWEVLEELTELNRACARKLCPEGPLGLLGHSAGSLIGLRAILRDPGSFGFAWISSPLLRPELRRHPVLVFLLRSASVFLPKLTVSTGVSRDMCLHPQLDPVTGENLDPSDDALNHDRICLGWADELVRTGEWVRDRFTAHPPAIPLLITQGSDDPICPAPIVRELVAAAKAPSIRYEEFKGALHEPFCDLGKEAVFEVIDEWLRTVLPAVAQETSPSG